MNIKKTFICFEPGESHPALCVLVKYSQQIGTLNPKYKIIYDVRTLESFPVGITYNDVLQRIKTLMSKYVMGDIRFILGYTYISESVIRFFNGTNLKPAKITVTGDPESYKDNFILHVPYKEIAERIDVLKETDTLTFDAEVSELLLNEDDDLDLCLGMAVWYAAHDADQLKEKKFIEFK